MTKPSFRIEMMPAMHGDALLIEYGNDRLRRLLIDGGPLGAYAGVEKRLAKLPPGDQAIELLVVTHVDTDHVEGIIRLMAMPVGQWPIYPREIWFNGWRHIEEANTLGGREGEMMSALIHYRANDRWNTRFDRKAVRCGALPGDTVTLDDGMKLILISPDASALADLRDDWKDKLAGWNVDPGDLAAAWDKLVAANKFHPGAKLTLGPKDLTATLLKQLKGIDNSKANCSSIAFIAEFAGKSCMLLGDSSMEVVCPALKRLGYSSLRPLKVDAVKVSHHGSRNNITKEFLSLVDAKHWLISSDGVKFKHPSDATVKAITVGSIRRPTLWFNYRSKINSKWERAAKKAGARFSVKYPPKGKAGIVVRL